MLPVADGSPFAAVDNRRTKIVATLGPASSNEVTFRQLVRAGLDVARLNFSHGSHEQKLELIKMVREVATQENKPLCILGDLQGPKIRTGKLVDKKPVQLTTGQSLTITPRDIAGTANLISTTFLTLAENLTPGARILLSDGLIELHVTAIRGDDVECTVINGGMLGENKGINLPGISVKTPSLTEKDEIDLKFCIDNDVDAIAVSFVRTAEDVRYTRDRARALGGDIWLIAKLEKPQAIEHLEGILEIADGVMVARGDLGVEVPPEKVPALQKHVIRRAGEYRKPVITATQMLESMIENPRPTRAEASDVANAVYDGTDAVMLSAESAAGKYPVEAVKMMDRIVVESEAVMVADPSAYRRRSAHVRLSISETICESMAHAAEDLDIGAIAVFTETGTTARQLSKWRPKPPIFALSSVPKVIRRMNLLWGVHPLICAKMSTTEAMVEEAEDILTAGGYVKSHEILGIVAGTRTLTGSTNFLRLHVLGDRAPGHHDESSAHELTTA
ncbi:MAG TPA: pyruvate kinase [Acidobacteriaceae bacterium]